jgi:hypothetical protein
MRPTRKQLEPFPGYTTNVMRSLGMEPDPWQAQVLQGDFPRLLLNCSRQAGKTTVVAVLALVEAVLVPHSLVLILSRSHRQSKLVFRKVIQFYDQLGARYQKRRTAQELELEGGNQIVCLPCQEQTIRGYSDVTLMIIDEAARVPDELYRAVRPMLIASEGQLICLSTPYGKRGWFYNAWARGGDWARIEVPAERIPRIKPERLEEERRALGETAFRQEYCCSFESVEGLVHPRFAQQVRGGRLADEKRAWAYGKKVGGIDFGYTQPFAAVWGVLDYDGVLWLTGEHYSRERVLAYHAAQLPRDVVWTADPSEPGQIAELKAAGFKVRKAVNDRTLGMTAVRTRLETGRLRVIEGRCPNLLAEAELYVDQEKGGKDQQGLDNDNDHAMDALRYLVMMLDRNKVVGGWKRWFGPRDVEAPLEPELPPRPRKWLSIYNEALWTPVGLIRKD